jgi:hypothetical protein
MAYGYTSDFTPKLVLYSISNTEAHQIYHGNRESKAQCVQLLDYGIQLTICSWLKE